MSYDAGDYLFKVSAQGFGKAQSGSDFFFLEGTPVAIIQDGKEFSVEPFKRTIRLTITEKSAPFVVDKLVAIGWEGGSWRTLDPTESVHHSFIGEEVRTVCTIEPGFNDPGKLYEKWDLPFVGEATEHDPSIARKLDALFGRSRPKNGSPAKTKTEPKKESAKEPDRANDKLQEAAAEFADQDDSIPF